MKLRHEKTTKGAHGESVLRDILRDDLPFPGACVAGEVPPEYAPLFCAAPELLAALRALAECAMDPPAPGITRRIVAIDNANAAIAKAEGPAMNAYQEPDAVAYAMKAGVIQRATPAIDQKAARALIKAFLQAAWPWVPFRWKGKNMSWPAHPQRVPVGVPLDRYQWPSGDDVAAVMDKAGAAIRAVNAL